MILGLSARAICGRLFLMLAVCACLTACKPSAQSAPEIIHAKLGGHDLYIPKEYVKLKNTGITTESALIQAWYPGSGIVPGDSANELWAQGVWWKNIKILINHYKTPASVERLANSRMENLKAYEIVGSEYGLIHRGQPDGYVKDHRDIWFEIENEKVISFITCSEKLTETDFPQCTQYLRNDLSMWLEISYDRRFLPEWKTIKESVEAMFESFRTEDTARAFILARMKEVPQPDSPSKQNANHGER